MFLVSIIYVARVAAREPCNLHRLAQVPLDLYCTEVSLDPNATGR